MQKSISGIHRFLITKNSLAHPIVSFSIVVSYTLGLKNHQLLSGEEYSKMMLYILIMCKSFKKDEFELRLGL